MYSEKSKADDVQFILDLIAKIGAEIPEADMNNVNIAGIVILTKSAGKDLLISRLRQWSIIDLPDPHQYWGWQTVQKVVDSNNYL